MGVAYHYNTAGYLVQEKDASSSYVIRQVSARDSRNEVIAATLANGALTQSAAFYPATGQMQSIAVTGPGGSLHDLDYEYDGYGNLNYQTTTIGAAVSTEGFFYDALHRLTQSSRSFPTGSKTVNYAYDPSGNLTLKDDYATSYTYSTTTRPNAVTSITKVGGGSVTFSYDANGNLTSGDGKSLTYTAFNKPRTITAGGITATFHYGANLARYRQEKTNGETTLYIDKLMEIVSVGASTDYRHYLGENAILTKIDSLSDPYPALKIVLRDRLGSVVTLTDETGTNPERRGYDPFGKPRDGDWAEKTPPTIGSGTTDRGFTDHEHLDESKLIHMNGRAYDYQLGRFLSVDPFIQEPGNSQSLNPYSYIMNNPLAGTDPSGYACQSKAAVGDCLKGLSTGQSDDIVNSDGDVIGSITKGQDGAFAIQRNNGVTGFFGANMQMIGAVDASGNGIDSIGSQHGGNGSEKKSDPGFIDLTVDAVKEGRGDILRDALGYTADFLDGATGVDGSGKQILDWSGAGPLIEGSAGLVDGNPSMEQAIWLGIAVASRGKVHPVFSRSLDDLTSLRGASPSEIEKLIPGDWIKKPLKKGDGTRYLNPNRKGEAIMIESGKRNAVDPIHRGPYLRVSRDGEVVRIPLEGNPTL